MKLLLMAILAFSIYTASSAYAAENTVWPVYKHDLRHTGQSSFNGSQENTLRWIFPTGDRIQGSPIVGPDGSVYVGSHDSTLYAINTDGMEKWRFAAEQRIDSTPAIASDGTIYFGSWDKSLYSLAPSGNGKWKDQASDRISTSPMIGPDSTIYIGSDDGFLYAVYPNGTLKWSFRTAERVFSSAALASDGTVYVGSFDNNLYAINPDGTEKWRFKTGDFVFSSPAIGADGTIYFGSYDKHLYALYPNSTMKWSFTTGGSVQSSPSIASDGTVYVGSFDNNLYAINPDGTEKWRFKTGDLVVSSPAIGADGTIYFGSVDAFLYAINPDGTEKWRFKTNDRIFSSPAIGADGTIYFGSVDGNLYAIGKPLESPVPGLQRSGRVNEMVGYGRTEMYVASTNVLPNHTTNEVSVEVVVKNIDLGPRSFDLQSFKLKDVNGNEYSLDPEKSTLKGVRIQQGDAIRGVLFFKSDADISATQLLYEDIFGVRLTVNLLDVKIPPDAGPTVSLSPGSNIGKKIIGKNLEMTILDEKFLESNPPQYTIRLSFTNKGLNEIKYDQAFAYVKDASGNVFLPDTSKLFRGTIGAGQTVTGEIWFTIQSNVSDVVFVYDDIATYSYFTVPEFPLSIFAVAGAVSLFVVLYRLKSSITQKV